jgi:ABC-2 type transport system permease protein
MRFPRLVIPLSISMTGLLTLAANLVVGMVLAVIFGVDVGWGWFAIPFIIAWLMLVTTGVEVLLAASFVRFRDVGQAWNVIARVLFYASPILYPIETVDGALRDVVLANPLSIVFLEMRHWVVDPSSPSFWQTVSSPWLALIPIAIGIGIAVYAFRFFVREAPGVGEAL